MSRTERKDSILNIPGLTAENAYLLKNIGKNVSEIDGPAFTSLVQSYINKMKDKKDCNEEALTAVILLDYYQDQMLETQAENVRNIFFENLHTSDALETYQTTYESIRKTVGDFIDRKEDLSSDQVLPAPSAQYPLVNYLLNLRSSHLVDTKRQQLARENSSIELNTFTDQQTGMVGIEMRDAS